MEVGMVIDPSKLHLKKELSQIRRAAKALRDPGTSISARSHHYNDGKLKLPLQLQSKQSYIKCIISSNKGSPSAKRVFLYNWRNGKSESPKSRQMGEDDVGIAKSEGSSSSSTQEESRDGNDSKSDSYASAIFKCKDTNFKPSIRRGAIKNKSGRSNYSSASSAHHRKKLQMQILLSRYAKNVVNGLPGSSLGMDDLLSLVHQSDGTEDCCNSEDLARAFAVSPLLARCKDNTKLLRSHKKEENSYSYSSTPALSASSYKRYTIRDPSIADSWDATTRSFNDADDDQMDDDQLNLAGQQGCGIPCYWSKRSTPKSRSGSCCSPSLSDTLRRKGRSIFSASQTIYKRKRPRLYLGPDKRRLSSKIAVQSSVPLLKNSADDRGLSMESENSDDELSTNFGELELEAMSRLDGRRWSSSCRSQQGLELVVHEDGSPENIRSLSHKYRPMFFEELFGQDIVVQSLKRSISRRRIAPIYLFQGPRGIGKTSTARIFAAALNCLATEETRPCGVCRECADILSGKSSYLGEVDGSKKKGIAKINNLLRNISVAHPSALPYKVFVIDECRLLPSKTWLSFLGILEKPLPHIVFILITTDIDNVPHSILSRCQKHIFYKISNGDIVARLRKISTDERLDVESNALELIASIADGSLRDAETMLDQFSLFGKRITKSLVNELIGVVSEEKLLDLLELALSPNATETVIRARELMDSGVDPIVVMSQLVTLIVDIIAATYPSVNAKQNGSFSGGRNLTERELDRLKYALTLFSEAEKHFRVSSERSTWFTATLLQLGSVSSPDQTQSTSSRRPSSGDHTSITGEAAAQKQRTDVKFTPKKSASPASFLVDAHCNSKTKEKPVLLTDAVTFDYKPNQSQFIDDDCRSGTSTSTLLDSKILIDIWLQCIDKCHSKTLRLLLHSYGRLVSVSNMKGGFVAQVAFEDSNTKTRAEGFLSSITNSFEIVLRRNVEVKIILLQDSFGGNLDLNLRHDQLKVSRGQSLESVSGNSNTSSSKDNKPDVPLRRIESIIHEQRLESAWLQAMDKGTPGSISHLKPERNQVMPQDGIDHANEFESTNSLDLHLKHWEDELNHEIKALKINDKLAHHKDQSVKRINHYPISPCLLHNSNSLNNFSPDITGYESGSGAGGCSGGMFCWNNSKPQRRGKAMQGAPAHPHKSGRFSWFGECAKSRSTDNRYSR